MSEINNILEMMCEHRLSNITLSMLKIVDIHSDFRKLEKENAKLKAKIDKRDALLKKSESLIESYKLILKCFDKTESILALYCDDLCERNVALIKSKCDEYLKELNQRGEDELIKTD